MEKITEKKEEAVIKLQAEILEVKRKKGRVKNIKFELPTRDAFIINLKVIEGSILSTPIEELEQLTNYPEKGEIVRDKIKDTINKAGEFFYAYLEDITFKKRKVGVKLKNIPPGEEEAIKEQCNSIIKDEFILGIIEYFFEEQDKKKQRGESFKEEKFLTDIIEKVGKHIDPTTDNPGDMMKNVMQSGVFNELIDTMNNGINDGDLDLGKMMSSLQMMMGNIGQILDNVKN